MPKHTKDYNLVDWLVELGWSAPGSALRPLFLINLALLIVLGTAACGWMLHFTNWFPEVGGVLALGGVFSWLAFVFRLIPDDTSKAMRAGFAAGLNGLIALSGIAALGYAMWVFASHRGAIRIEARQGAIPGEAWIWEENKPADRPEILSADGVTNIPVEVTSPVSRYIKIKGRPMVTTDVRPRHRTPISYPDGFQRHVLLVAPSACAVNALAAAHARVELQVEVMDEQGKNYVSMTIPDYDWFAFWVGCSSDVVWSDVARSEILTLTNGVTAARAAVFAMPPRSEPSWFPGGSSWTSTERVLPEKGCLRIKMTAPGGLRRSQESVLKGGGSEFIEVIPMDESHFFFASPGDCRPR